MTRLDEIRERVASTEVTQEDLIGWYFDDIPYLLAEVERLRGALEPLTDAVGEILGTLNFYTGPHARTAVSRESVDRYWRVHNANEAARSTLGAPETREGEEP